MSDHIRSVSYHHLPSSFETFGIQCESGWLPLIRPLIDYIDSYNQHKPDSEQIIIILQIKQKFGGLSFHTNFTDETLERMIEQVQQNHCMCVKNAAARSKLTVSSSRFKAKQCFRASKLYVSVVLKPMCKHRQFQSLIK